MHTKYKLIDSIAYNNKSYYDSNKLRATVCEHISKLGVLKEII